MVSYSKQLLVFREQTHLILWTICLTDQIFISRSFWVSEYLILSRFSWIFPWEMNCLCFPNSILNHHLILMACGLLTIKKWTGFKVLSWKKKEGKNTIKMYKNTMTSTCKHIRKYSSWTEMDTQVLRGFPEGQEQLKIFPKPQNTLVWANQHFQSVKKKKNRKG